MEFFLGRSYSQCPKIDIGTQREVAWDCTRSVDVLVGLEGLASGSEDHSRDHGPHRAVQERCTPSWALCPTATQTGEGKQKTMFPASGREDGVSYEGFVSSACPVNHPTAGIDWRTATPRPERYQRLSPPRNLHHHPATPERAYVPRCIMHQSLVAMQCVDRLKSPNCALSYG